MRTNRTLLYIGAGVVASLLIADAAPSVPLQEQGNVIQLNGQPWAGRWIKRAEAGQQVLFLQDEWLKGALGMEMLDSERADRQRARWFSSPFFAATTFDRPVQHRYLNIEALSPQWRTEIAGNVLKIFTPDTTVQAIRRAKQEQGDRIVIDLSRRTPWQVQQQGNILALTLAAELAPNVPTGINTDKGNFVTAVDTQAQGKQTILRIQTSESFQPVIETLSEPDRIIIDIKRDALPPSQTILWIDGIQRRQEIVTLPIPAAKSERKSEKETSKNPKPAAQTTPKPETKPTAKPVPKPVSKPEASKEEKQEPKVLRFPVTSLLVDLKQAGLTMRPIWSNPQSMLGTSSLPVMAEQAKAAAAINGGFFNLNRRLPVGPIKDNKRWMAGPVLNRGAIAWNPEGEILMDRLAFQETLTTSTKKTIPLTHLNSGYVQKGVARYTPSWGKTYVPLTDGEVVIAVKGDRVISQIKAGKTGQGQITIPQDGYILVARQSPELVAQLTTNVTLRGATAVKPLAFNQFPYLIGAGPLLLKNGEAVLNASLEQFRPPFDKQGAIRSAIAATAKEGELILATIHATPEGITPSLAQTAEILKKMGAVDALNLDGGGSTTLYLGGAVISPNANNLRPIHNGIGIFITTPEPNATTQENF